MGNLSWRRLNLAPFSYFTAVSSRTTFIDDFCGKKPNGEIKDTTRNALETGKLVIHIAPSDLADKVTLSSATLEHGESELETTQLETVDFQGFELPRIEARQLHSAVSCTK